MSYFTLSFGVIIVSAGMLIFSVLCAWIKLPTWTLIGLISGIPFLFIGSAGMYCEGQWDGVYKVLRHQVEPINSEEQLRNFNITKISVTYKSGKESLYYADLETTFDINKHEHELSRYESRCITLRRIPVTLCFAEKQGWSNLKWPQDPNSVP